ncbi:MAG: ABC transporter substrate-binding protein [Bryobacteraceae bacterium]|jgi:branched-chain amino acid transport system substrate-binding protein
MRARSGFAGAILLALSIPALAQRPDVQPYHRAQPIPAVYDAAGQEDPPPASVDRVPIGYFGPSDPGHFAGGSVWQGTVLAIEQANAAGGWHGVPFVLVPVWSENPWTAGAARLIAMLYSERAPVLIAGIDGPSAHLAEQVTTKALIPVVNPAATDRSIQTAGVPWMFTCLPGDHLQATVLTDAIARDGQPFALLTATDHDSRAFAGQLKTAFAESRMSPKFQVEFEAGTNDSPDLGQRVLDFAVHSLVLVAGPHDTARVLRVIRERGFAGRIYAGPAASRAATLAAADGAAEGVFFPLLVQDVAETASLRVAFRTRFGREPDWAAEDAWDTANIVVAAIRKAGMNRARIRDAIEGLSPWHGATGTIHWDERGQNDRGVRLGVIRNGQPAVAN